MSFIGDQWLEISGLGMLSPESQSRNAQRLSATTQVWNEYNRALASGDAERAAEIATGPAWMVFGGVAGVTRGVGGVANSGAAAYSKLSQPGGLAATEGHTVLRYDGRLSEATHPLTKHGPDVSDQYIYNRVVDELSSKNRMGSRTAFNDRAQMERAINETFAARQSDISAWLASDPRAGVPRAFEWNPGMGNLGRGYEVTAKGGPIVPISRPMPNVNLVLIPDGKGSFLILTVHPK